TRDTTIVIEPHQGSQAILQQLRDAALLPAVWTIELPFLLSGRARQLKAGEYALTAGMTPADILEKIAKGQVVIHKISIPEGWNIWQVRAAFLAEPLLTGDIPTIAEGSIFPDTMRFQRGATRASIITQMQKHMAEVLDKEWAARDPAIPLKSPQDAVILASIIEKETGVAEERPMVAAVFYNRLKIGMKLQSDPTVVYGLQAIHDGVPLGRALTSVDLAYDTPHNSYTREGLPPTPICSPGLAAIQAALHPATTDALYFVATGVGGHYFSKTLAQHNGNVQNYKKLKKK
ncbi:MAG: hypothetical protein B7X02_01605, partial [Rhodospirillales bacterium 12-54-5]